MKTLLALLVAGLSYGALAMPAANAQPISPLASGTGAAYVNETVVISTGHHRRYRTVRRVYFRNGHRVVVYRRAYY